MARQRIELQPEEAGELRRRVRAGTVSVRDRRRAEIILLSAQGLTQQQIAERLGISRLQVNRWVGRFALRPAGGLSDAPGRGRKPWLAARGGAASAGAGGDAAAPSRAMELPHDGPRRRRSRRPACSACGRPMTSSRISRAPSNCRTTSTLKRSSGT